MHEPVHDDVDVTIDRAVREMLAVDPDATFDARVLGAIPRQASVVWPRLAAAAACAALAAIVLVPAGFRWFERAPGPQASHVDGGGIEAARTAPPVLAPSDTTVGGGAGQGIATDAPRRDRGRAAPAPHRRPQHVQETARGAAVPGGDTVARGDAAAPVTGAEPLPGLEPLPAIEPLTIASLPREAASLQAGLLAPLEPIAAIEIPPLSPSEWRE